jgi:hypothetical protein
VWGQAETDADKLATTRHNSMLTLAQEARYAGDLSRLEQFRAATIVTLSLTVALGSTTAALFWLDHPKLADDN